MTIPLDVANHVLYYYRRGGYQPGSFTEALLSAIARADSDNLARLGAGFPEYVQAMTMAMYDGDGMAKLQDLAAVRP